MSPRIFPMVLGASLLGGTAIAAEDYTSAQGCESDTNDNSFIKYDDRGVRSTDTSTRERVWCPFQQYPDGLGGLLPSRVGIYLDDANTNNGTSYQFTCGLKYRTSTGTVYSASEQSSTDGYQKLVWTYPFGTTGLPETGSYSAYCYIPVSTGTADSFVLGLFTE